MRATLDHYELQGATVRIEVDTGGPVGGEHVVSITGDEYRVTRWFYFDEFDERYARNFAEKIITNPQYRAASLEGTADWRQIAQIYEPAAHRIYEIFEDAGLTGYRAGDDEEEARYREAKATWETLCEGLFQDIRNRVRDDASLENLNDRIDAQVAEARRKADDLTS